MHLHEFLHEVNRIILPRTYLEVGVQTGTSLRAGGQGAKLAVGIDPEPQCEGRGGQLLFHMTSDQFFAQNKLPEVVLHDSEDPNNFQKIDLGFIDGLHHFEQALRDFLNIERFCHRQSVVIFDDVLPRNQGEANRVQCPGDWTGDVWKVTDILLRFRPELRITQVDTDPTGTLMVWNFGSPAQSEWARKPQELAELAETLYMDEELVPPEILARSYAVTPDKALQWLKEFIEQWKPVPG